MQSHVIYPDKRNFAQLVQLQFPSVFRYDLQPDQALFHRTDKISGERRADAVAQKLKSLIRNLSLGHPIHFGDYPNGVYYRLLLTTLSGQGIAYAQKGRGVIALVERFRGEERKSLYSLRTFSLVFFPAPEDVPAYLKAGAYSRKLGPADTFPGSVGTLVMVYDKTTAQIVEFQSSIKYSCSEAREILDAEGLNCRNKYFKWRFNMLELAFNFAQDFGLKKILIGPSEDPQFPLSCKVKSHEIIIERGLRSGFELGENDNALLVKQR